jgi:hypothetical protein
MSAIASTLLVRDWIERARLIEGMPRSPAIASSAKSELPASPEAFSTRPLSDTP